MTVGFPTAKALSTDRLQKTINQTTHNFGVGDLVINDALGGPPIYQLALGDTLANSQGVMMVSRVINADNFVVTQCGYVANITDQGVLVAGVQYYLSPTLQGALTSTRPTTTGQVIIPCFVADSANSGFYFGGSGTLIEPDGSGAIVVSTTTPVNMAANTTYVANGGAAITFVLPAAYSVGDSFNIIDHSGFGFVVTQTLGGVAQQVFDLGVTSTAGTTGTTTTTVGGQTISLKAVVANAALRVESNKGTFIYA